MFSHAPDETAPRIAAWRRLEAARAKLAAGSGDGHDSATPAAAAGDDGDLRALADELADDCHRRGLTLAAVERTAPLLVEQFRLRHGPSGSGS